MEQSANGLMAKTTAGFAANTRQIETVCAIEKAAHTASNLINRTNLNEETISISNDCRNPADASRQHRASAGHCLHEHTAEGLRIARKDESATAPH
jgi:hypothetical protein